MNERLNQQDFIDLLAEKHGMNKKNAEKFVKEFFLLIEEALESDKLVKLKGLGTFKLVDVDTRESVNINTGERFQIQGYTKISFIPDNSLRDIINKPFAHFETVPLNETTVLDDTPVVDEEEKEENSEDEEVDVLNDSDLPDQLVVEERQEVEKTSAVDPVSDVEIVSQEGRKLSADEIIAREIQAASPITPLPVKEKTKKHHREAIEKSPVPYLISIIIIVLILCGGAVLFIYYPNLFDSIGNKPEITEVELTEKPIFQQPVHVIDTTATKDTVAKVSSNKNEVEPDITPVPVKKVQEEVHKEVKAPFIPDSVNYIITGTKATYTIKEGETLTRVALRFYGTKALWPYIVKHNPKIIKNPDNVPYGTTIEIPELVRK